MISGRIARTAGLAVLLLVPVAGCSGPEPVWVEGRTLSSPAASPAPVPSEPTATAESPEPSPAAPSRSATSAAATTAPPPVALRSPDRFVAAVRQELPELALDRRDEEIADLGDEACAGREDVLAAYGVSADQARRLIGFAHADLCP